MLKQEIISFPIDRRIFNFVYNCKLRECYVKISNEQNNSKRIKHNDNYYFVKNNNET